MTHRSNRIEAELGGKRYTLCLTLGALAELEQAFAASDLVGLAKRFEDGLVSARDIIRLVGCGLRGGGHAISDAEVAALPVAGGLAGYIEVATRLIVASFGPFADHAAAMQKAPPARAVPS